MVALADLLDTVLPPLGSNEPGYTVRASLRMLAPRARGRAGLPLIEAPEMLGAALGEHVGGEPGRTAPRPVGTRRPCVAPVTCPPPAKARR